MSNRFDEPLACSEPAGAPCCAGSCPRAEQQRTAAGDRSNEEVAPAHHGVAASSRFAGSSVATYPLGARRRSACGTSR
jgi:hypothetical protein